MPGLGVSNARVINRGRRFQALRGQWGDDGVTVVAKRAMTAEAADALRHEYVLLRRVEGAGVVKALGLVEQNGHPLLVLEDAGPENLKARLTKGPLQLETFLHIAVRLAETLARVHDASIVHRDVCPDNVVLRAPHEPTLIDFDLATDAVTVVAPGHPEQLQGTLATMSPEQTGRMNRVVDARSDLYSLGATFYEALTGAPPFVESTPAMIVQAHLTRAPAFVSDVAPQVPPAVASIIAKLLEKIPEDRYQSAAALAQDLRTARTQWYAHRSVEPFELGVLDRVHVLALPEVLYGRDREIGAVRAAMRRVRSGAREFLMVTGEPGGGKTALLDEIAVRVGGPVLRGQFGAPGEAPYSALRSAFGVRLAEIVHEPPDASAAVRRRIGDELGANAPVLAQVLPELRWLLGALPPVAPTRPAGDALRFRFTFAALARALADPDVPLVLLLDDAQAADSASLEVLRAIATDAGMEHILLVVACRTECMDPQHPFTRLLADVGAAGTAITTMSIGPLTPPEVCAFVADALGSDPVHVEPLAELIFRHSAGVPLYVRSVLASLHDAGLLVHDDRRGRWTWDIRRIAAFPLPTGAVDLLVASVARLPLPTQQALSMAACIGRSFELGTLAAVADEPVEESARRIWPAVRAGVLIPDAAELPRASTPVYRFVHDRVQQTTYERMAASERSEAHLRVGRALLARPDAEADALFAIVEQLERGADRLTSAQDRLSLSRLELRAGRRARASVAYGPALSYFVQGIERLPENVWSTDRDLAFDLHRDAAECCYVVGDGALLEVVAGRAEAERLSLLERSELDTLRVSALTRDGRFQEAVQRGRAALARLGVELPKEIDDAALHAELDRIAALIAGRTAALLDAPMTTDPVVRAKSTLLSETATALYFLDPNLSILADALVLPLTLARGTTADTATAIIAIARRFGAVRGQWERADAMASVALELARRAGDRGRETEAFANVASFIQAWHAPLRSCVPLLRRAFELGVSSGAMTFAAYARSTEALTRFTAGEPLSTVEAEADAARELAQRVGNPIAEMPALLLRQEIRALRGATSVPFALDDPDYDDAATVESIEQSPITAHFRHRVLLELAVFLGRFEEARQHADACAHHRPFVRGMIGDASARFFGALAWAAPSRGSATTLARLREDQAALASWARSCPENFGFMERTVAAEIARLEGRSEEAFDLYDQAIELAAEQRAMPFEALICERAAAHRRRRGRARGATLYLASARDAYARWGATAKVRLLDVELPAFALTMPVREERGGAVTAFELSAVQRAAEEIVSALDWEPLLDRILAATRNLAGATRAALVLAEDARLTVRGTLGEGALRATPMRAPLDADAPLAISPVELAWRTGETVLVVDAREDASLHDPYLESHDVRSILAVPVQRNAVRTGVIYLEHRVSPRAFDAEQVAALTLLASYVTTALDNSSLFDKLRHEIEERRRVQERMRFLADASMALAESLEYGTTLRRVARLSVQRIADWCAIDIIEDGGVRRVAEAWDDGAGVTEADAGETFEPPAGSPVCTAKRGQAVLVPDLSERDRRALATDEEDLARLQALSVRTLVSVPIAARGEVIGAISIACSRRRVRYGAADLRLAAELAARAALAIENARLYRASREAVRMRDEFLSVASHELRGPVSALQLTLQGLTSGMFSQLPPDATRPVAIAERQALRLGRLVEELLDVSRMRSGKLHLRLEEMKLSDLVTDIAERFEGELAKAGCTLDVKVQPDVIGRWDSSRLGQVIENLLSNAIKFGRGKPISICAEEENGIARIVIRDRGVGIPTERIPFIFDRFERAVSPEHFGGLGLGLYIVREIVGALGGRVRVESVEGEGSTFTVELPLRGPARTSAPEQTGRRTA